MLSDGIFCELDSFPTSMEIKADNLVKRVYLIKMLLGELYTLLDGVK